MSFPLTFFFLLQHGQAVRRSTIELTRLLVSVPHLTTQPDAAGNTALHYAARCSAVEGFPAPYEEMARALPEQLRSLPNHAGQTPEMLFRPAHAISPYDEPVKADQVVGYVTQYLRLSSHLKVVVSFDSAFSAAVEEAFRQVPQPGVPVRAAFQCEHKARFFFY